MSNSRQTGIVAAPWSNTPPTLPLYHPAPSFSDLIPHASPHSASTAAQNVLLLRLRVPYHARNSSCAALAGTQTAGRRAASFCGTRTPGFFASARTIERSPHQGGGGFCITLAQSESGAGFCPDPALLKKWCLVSWQGVESSWLDFLGAAWRGAALIFQMVVGTRGSAFLWCGF